MKQKNLYIMCGAPGSGKSTWLANNAKENSIVISRDAVRFSIINDEDEYFSKEKTVFKTFIQQIQRALDNENGVDNIYCDATHITKASRDKLLNSLNLTNAKNITVIVLRPSLDETLKRNKLRTGRARVPDSALIRMWRQFQRPEEDEDRVFDTMYVEVPDSWQKLG